MTVTASYPGGLIVFPTLKDHIDAYKADDNNQRAVEIMALQQYVGTSPHGSRSSFADRMNVMIGSYGGIQGGTGFPAQTTPRRLFYRDDLETLYIRRADNSGEQAIGGTLTNVVFEWHGNDDALIAVGTTSFGLIVGTGLSDDAAAGLSRYNFFSNGANAGTNIVLRGRLKKVSGMSTVTMQARIWGTSPTSILTVNGVNAVSAAGSSTPGWVATGTLDISGLGVGTVYDLTVALSNSSKLSSVVVFVS